jgi:putative component of membrane protein insertase Oxa1/YidC/SpoIIIJ protein YidD
MSPRHFLFVAILLILVQLPCSGQNCRNDLQLIINHSDAKSMTVASNSHSLLKTKGTALNPLFQLLRYSMYFYQQIVSRQIGANCMYESSCSNFSKNAISRFGLVKGILLSADRLTRCTPGTLNETPSVFINEQNKIIDQPGFYTSSGTRH